MITQNDMNKILSNVNQVLTKLNERIEKLEQEVAEVKKPQRPAPAKKAEQTT